VFGHAHPTFCEPYLPASFCLTKMLPKLRSRKWMFLFYQRNVKGRD
jgi:hypothetical protein